MAPQGNPRSDGSESPAASKRQKTSMACDTCRNRKSRCDGARPTCASCATMGANCVYRRPNVAVTTEASGSASAIEWRLRMVENMMQHFTRGDPAYLSSPGSSNFAANVRVEEPQGLLVRDSGTDRLREDTVDGMASIAYAGEATSIFFGPSSNYAFLAMITRALGSRRLTSADQPAVVSRDLSFTISRPVSPSPTLFQPQRTADLNLLPPRPEMLGLVEGYFNETGRFFPFIRRGDLLETIEALKAKNPAPIRKSWLSLVNAIMAVGSSLNLTDRRENSPAAAVSDVFLERAAALSPWTASNVATLETAVLQVQALAVMTLYLQATSHTAQTWRMHGLMVQAAFHIGLHDEETTCRLPQLEQETRRRTWHMCLVLDVILSSTLGRSPLVRADLNRIPLPKTVDLDDPRLLEGDCCSPSGLVGSYCNLFVESIKLFRIQSDIIMQLYNGNVSFSRKSPWEEVFARVTKYDKMLHEWKMQLNSTTPLVRSNDTPLTAPDLAWSRPQVILTLRYLSTQLLLHKAVLRKCLEDAPAGLAFNEPEPFHDIAEAYIKICAHNARELIDLTASTWPTSGIVPAWWFAVYYIFYAALTLFGIIVLSRCGRPCLLPGESTELISYLHKTLKVLDLEAKETRISRRCSKYLRAIIQASDFLIRSNDTVRPRISRSSDRNSRNARDQYTPAPMVQENTGPTQHVSEFDQFFMNDTDFDFLNHLSDWDGADMICQDPHQDVV